MRQDLTIQTIENTGTDITFYVANSTEYQFQNWGSGSDVIIGIQNDGTASCFAAFITPWVGHSVSNLSLADTTSTIESGKTLYFSDFDPELFNQRGSGKSLGSGGFVFLNLDSTQNISLAAFKAREAK